MFRRIRIAYLQRINHKLFLVISILCFIVVLTIHFFRTSDKFEYRTTTSPPETTTIDSRFENKKLNGTFIFKESRRAHRLLDGLFGLEIGASFHNPYGLKTLNIDYTDEITPFSQHALDYGFTIPKVHIACPGDNLPFTNDSVDFVISSDVIEHFWDPIKAIKEWLRVVKPGGYVYMDIPHKERIADSARNRTTLLELLKRHTTKIPHNEKHTAHHNVWIPEDVLELAQHFKWPVAEWCDVDDKTSLDGAPPIGFTVVLQKKIRY